MNIYSTIEFISRDDYYIKELSGTKNNTVRIVTKKEDECLQLFLKTIHYIKIKHTDELQSFTRELTDITRYTKDTMIIYIFSWRV